MLVLIGVAAAFRTAFLPHTTKPSVASKLAQTNPVAVPPQWLPVLLAANTPRPPANNRRLLDNTFASKAELETAVGEYNTNVTAAEGKYGTIDNWDVSGITDMSWLFFQLRNFNADISSWDTSGVTTMAYMFYVRTLAPTSSREPFPGCRLRRPPRTARSPPGPHLTRVFRPACTSPRFRYIPSPSGALSPCLPQTSSQTLPCMLIASQPPPPSGPRTALCILSPSLRLGRRPTPYPMKKRC